MSPTIIDGCDLSEPAPGRLLPPRAFFSPAVFDAEMTRIFARSWVHVADLPELRAPGDFVAATIGTSPVVIVRGHDGALRGFLNVCPHRGATIAEGRGNCGRQLQCPYHAWSFATDGRLVGAPSRGVHVRLLDDRPASDCGRDGRPHGLRCLDAEAAGPFAAWIGELPQALGRAGGARMELAFEYVYEVDVNWKVYVENGLEGYHVAVVHDVLNDFVETKSARQHLEEHASYTHAFIKPEYRAMIPELPHLSAEEQTYVRFGHVFPNLIPVLAPAEFSYLRIDPLGPERIRLVARSFDLGGDLAALRDFRRDALDRTNQQDIGVVTRVQRGLHAHGFRGGVHSAFLESRIGHFERMVSRALTGAWRSLARSGCFTHDEATAALRSEAPVAATA